MNEIESIPHNARDDIYDKLNIAMDHMLFLYGKGDGIELPKALKLRNEEMGYEEAWEELEKIKVDRIQTIIKDRTRQKLEKALLKQNTDKKSETIKSETVKKEKRKINSSKRISDSKQLEDKKVIKKEYEMKSKGNTKEDHEFDAISHDLLQQLHQIPMLADIEMNTKKFHILDQWINANDGKNKAIKEDFILNLQVKWRQRMQELKTEKQRKINEIKRRKEMAKKLENLKYKKTHGQSYRQKMNSSYKREKKRSNQYRDECDESEEIESEESDEQEYDFNMESEHSDNDVEMELSDEETKKSSNFKSSKSGVDYNGVSPVNPIVLDSSDESDNGPILDTSHMDASAAVPSTEVFNLEDSDVFVVEAILEEKVARSRLATNAPRTKMTKKMPIEPNLYLVKWEGYNELTWEPAGNIPKILIDDFHKREKLKKETNYQVDSVGERRIAPNTTSGRDQIIYLIKWKNQKNAVWESRATLPQNVVVLLDKISLANPTS